MSESEGSAADSECASTWDRRATLIWMLVFLVLSNIPYALALLMTREGFHFSGVLSIPNDVFSYFAKMRVGYDGHWQYINRYTTEPTQPSLLFMFYVFLGHLARWTGLGVVGCYHVARILGSLALMLAVRRLMQHAGLVGRGAVAAFVLCFGVSALAWLPQQAHFGAQPMVQYVGEAYCFITMMYFAHLAVSTALLVVVITEFLRLRNGSGVGSILVAGMASFLMAWIHPRLLLTAGVVGLALGIEVMIRGNGLPKRLLVGGLASFMGGFLPAFLILRSYKGDPILSSWAEIQTWSPNLWTLLLGYGASLPLAALGAASAIRRKLPGATLLTAWLVLGLGICYCPWFDFQRRMFQGMDIPIALLAGIGLDHVVGACLQRFALNRRAVALGSFTLLIALVTAGFWPVFLAHLTPGFRGAFPWYFSDARMSALNWLRENTSREDVVLASYETGQLVPAYSGNPVVLGQWAETFQRNEKEKEVRQFFDSATVPEWRTEFLNRYGVSYLVFSNFEAHLVQSTGAKSYNPAYDASSWRVVLASPSPAAPEVMVLRRLVTE